MQFPARRLPLKRVKADDARRAKGPQRDAKRNIGPDATPPALALGRRARRPVVSGIDLRRRSTARFALNGVAQGKAVQRAISGCWRRALNRVFLRLRQVAAFTSQARVRMRAGMQRFAGFGIACCGWTPGL